jgi:hypothetical protein
MKRSIQITDFDFRPAGHGHYRVTYTSPKTCKKWSVVTDNMSIIDSTKNEDNPKIKSLLHLKRVCKEPKH